MTRDLLIAVDAGTSVIKAVAFDLAGNQLALARRANRFIWTWSTHYSKAASPV